MDLTSMGSLSLCNSSANQLMLVKDVVDLVHWTCVTIVDEESRLVWPSLIPDFIPPSRLALVDALSATDTLTPGCMHSL